jgi:multisubunit Na+/H+ antiporter MnhB subunit
MSTGTNPYSPGTAGMPSNPGLEQEIQKKATNAIIAAVVGIVCCPLVQIYTIMTANDALGQIKNTGAGQQHQTLATIAKVIGIVHLALVGVGIVIQIIVIAIGAGAAAVN